MYMACMQCQHFSNAKSYKICLLSNMIDRQVPIMYLQGLYFPQKKSYWACIFNTIIFGGIFFLQFHEIVRPFLGLIISVLFVSHKQDSQLFFPQYYRLSEIRLFFSLLRIFLGSNNMGQEFAFFFIFGYYKNTIEQKFKICSRKNKTFF